jgi:RimJ/RimL family protein N-acetyltransferase
MDNLVFEKARSRDAVALAEASRDAFHSDVHCGAPPGPPCGPPGYKSPKWQSKMMRIADYYKIVIDDAQANCPRVIGGIIVMRQGTRAYELARIFVDPEFQNRGIGTRAIEFLWKKYPLAKRWTLGTPAWNFRTRHFYKKVGFVEVGMDNHGGVLFERRIVAMAK